MAKPTGAPPTIDKYPAKTYRTLKRLAKERMEGDVKEVMDSLTRVDNKAAFWRIYSEYVTEALIQFCFEVLNAAVERTPYDTGELRSSGAVYIRTGKKQLTGGIYPAVDVRANRDGTWQMRKHTKRIITPSMALSAEISFYRIDDGKDIALWAHEDLLPYSKRPRDAAARRKKEEKAKHKLLYATKEGTGPKFLEGPFRERVHEVVDILQKSVDRAITEYNRRSGQRVRRRS